MATPVESLTVRLVLAAVVLRSTPWLCALATLFGLAGVVLLRGNRWRSGAIAPAGHVRIGSFHLDYSVPVWTYEIGDHRIEDSAGQFADVDRHQAAPWSGRG